VQLDRSRHLVDFGEDKTCRSDQTYRNQDASTNVPERRYAERYSIGASSGRINACFLQIRETLISTIRI
jgi:hypothetical protein